MEEEVNNEAVKEACAVAKSEKFWRAIKQSNLADRMEDCSTGQSAFVWVEKTNFGSFFVVRPAVCTGMYNGLVTASLRRLLPVIVKPAHYSLFKTTFPNSKIKSTDRIFRPRGFVGNFIKNNSDPLRAY